MLVKVLDRKRADYRPKTWRRYALLYEGGHAIEEAKREFLYQRPVERDEWYKLRLEEFHYKNLAGPALDELAGATLQSPVTMDLKREGEGERPTPEPFYTDQLWPDPTGKGEGGWNDLLFDALVRAMQKQEAWAIICFPGAEPTRKYASRREQEDAGALRACIRLIESEKVINAWSDDFGLSAVMLRDRIKPNEPLTDKDKEAKERIRWTLYSRKTIRQWEIEVEPGSEPKDDDEAAELETEQEHYLADAEGGRGRLPVRRLLLKKALWAMDRVGSLAANECSKRNAINWYELVACYPQPVHKGEDDLKNAKDGEQNKARGATVVLEIGPNDEFTYAEPSGDSLPHLKERLDQLERDIYKSLHNMAAAQGPQAAAQLQAAASKMRDAVAKNIICRHLAKKAREFARDLADTVGAARADDYTWEVSGADQHDLPDTGDVVSEGLSVQGLGPLLYSPTFQKAYWTKKALDLVPDADTETRDKISEEFEAMKVRTPDQDEDLDAKGEKEE